MSYVFISYAHADSEEVERIVSKLEASGIKVWIDRESIRAGRQWRKEIVEGIDRAGAFVLYLSPSSTASINVLKELNLAEETEDPCPCVIPVMLEDVPLPSQFRYQLAGVQHITYFEDEEKGYQVLENQILDRLEQEAKEGIPRPSAREIEVVIKDGSVAKFTDVVRTKLLQNLANISMGAVGDYVITRVVEGSLHVFVRMPLDDSYELQAQALNRDPRLLAAGISAIRFKSQGSYIVDGEFSSTPELESPTPPPTDVPLPADAAPAVAAPLPADPVTPADAATKKPRFWRFIKSFVKTVAYLVVILFAIYGLLCFLNTNFPQLNLPSHNLLALVAPQTILAAQPEPTEIPEATQTPSPTLEPTETPVPDTETPIPNTATPEATETATPTVTPSGTPTPSSTPTTSPSPTMTPSPTDDGMFATSKGQAFCRYGPSKAYLSYADIFAEDQVVVQGRYEYGGWVWVKPVGKPASCWIASSLLEPAPDVSELPVIDHRTSMIFSDDVDPPLNLTAVRNGSTVTISWDPIKVGPVDFRGYLLDGYVCQDGSYLKYIDDYQTTTIVITDELNSCHAGSEGKLYGVHARGYTDPVKIDWP